MIIENACLAAISFRLYQLFKFVPRRTFITDPKNIVVAVIILVSSGNNCDVILDTNYFSYFR